MPAPPPRKRFQIHLSTAVVMMFVAGGLIKLNVGAEAIFVAGFTQEGTEFNPIYKTFQRTGWPYRVHIIQIYLITGPVVPTVDNMPREVPSLQVSYLLIDIAIAVIALLCAAVLCEWLIRRAARKGQ